MACSVPGRRLVITPAAVRVGRADYPLAEIRSVRVVRGTSPMPLLLAACFVGLFANCVAERDPVGCSVFTACTVLSVLALLFPRRVLVLATLDGDRPVLWCWRTGPLQSVRTAVEDALARGGALPER